MTQGREFEERFFDRAVVVDMDRVLEHVVDEVGCRLDKVAQLFKLYHILALLLVEDVELVFVLEQIHPVRGLSKFGPLLLYHLLAVLDLFLFFLQRLNFFVDLFFHHLK